MKVECAIMDPKSRQNYHEFCSSFEEVSFGQWSLFLQLFHSMQNLSTVRLSYIIFATWLPFYWFLSTNAHMLVQIMSNYQLKITWCFLWCVGHKLQWFDYLCPCTFKLCIYLWMLRLYSGSWCCWKGTLDLHIWYCIYLCLHVCVFPSDAIE